MLNWGGNNVAVTDAPGQDQLYRTAAALFVGQGVLI